MIVKMIQDLGKSGGTEWEDTEILNKELDDIKKKKQSVEQLNNEMKNH